MITDAPNLHGLDPMSIPDVRSALFSVIGPVRHAKSPTVLASREDHCHRLLVWVIRVAHRWEAYR